MRQKYERTVKNIAWLMFKGTVSIISGDPLFKEGNARFTTVPLRPLCIYRVQTVQSVLNTTHTGICSRIQTGFDKFTHTYFYTRRTRKGFKEGHCCKSLHRGSLEIMLTLYSPFKSYFTPPPLPQSLKYKYPSSKKYYYNFMYVTHPQKSVRCVLL